MTTFESQAIRKLSTTTILSSFMWHKYLPLITYELKYKSLVLKIYDDLHKTN